MFCRYVSFLHTLLEDGVDDIAIFGAPEVVRGLLSRPLKSITGEL